MKVKFDFVSNSSSTSFVYISDEELTEQSFLESAGVNENSPVADLFRNMYSELSDSIQGGTRITTLEQADLLSGGYDFTPDVIDKMKLAIEQGKNVVTASLSSDGEFAESLLCMSIFEINSDKFYINAYNNYW